MRKAVLSALALAAWFVAAPRAPVRAEESRLALSYGSEEREKAREVWRRRVQRARADYETFAARAVHVYLSFQNPAPAPERNVARVTSIMRDPTLRVGDIYAAADGFMIFRGRIAAAHEPSDFTPMPDASARKFSLAIGAAR